MDIKQDQCTSHFYVVSGSTTTNITHYKLKRSSLNCTIQVIRLNKGKHSALLRNIASDNATTKHFEKTVDGIHVKKRTKSTRGGAKPPGPNEQKTKAKPRKAQRTRNAGHAKLPVGVAGCAL